MSWVFLNFFCQHPGHNGPLSLQHDLLNTPNLKCMSSEVMVGADQDMASGVHDGRFLTLSLIP